MNFIGNTNTIQQCCCAGAPPSVSRNQAAPRTYTTQKVTKQEPWRYTLGYEVVPIPKFVDQKIISQTMKPCYVPPGMITEPVFYPNYVTGVERNPQHAARASLHTRFTPIEWVNNCEALYKEADATGNRSSKLQQESENLIKEIDEQTKQNLIDAPKGLDLVFWRNELRTELDKLLSDTSGLSNRKRAITKAIQDLEMALYIAQECLFHRERRKGLEKVQDQVEKSLLSEVDNILKCRKKLETLLAKVNKQLSVNRLTQRYLESEYCQGMDYNKRDEDMPEVFSLDRIEPIKKKIEQSQAERKNSTKLICELDTGLNDVANSVWDHWKKTNDAIDCRATEMNDAKNKMEQHVLNAQDQLADMERVVNLLQSAIQAKCNHPQMLKAHVEPPSPCNDFHQMKVVQEIQEPVGALRRKLEEVATHHDQLEKTRANLTVDFSRKFNAIFIDREKCMGLRRSFPLTNMIRYPVEIEEH